MIKDKGVSMYEYRVGCHEKFSPQIIMANSKLQAIHEYIKGFHHWSYSGQIYVTFNDIEKSITYRVGDLSFWCNEFDSED
jgi:hypothetical protein